jgi:hypothetical protein
VAALCPHGLPAPECLICPALPQVATAAGAPQTRSRSSIHIAGVVAVIAVIGVAAWIVAGVVFAILHVLELVAVGAVAGWVGYRVGHFRGSRQDR